TAGLPRCPVRRVGAATVAGVQGALAPLATLTSRTAGATRPAGSPWTSARHNAGEDRVVERHDHGDPAAVSSGSPRSTAAAVASRGAAPDPGAQGPLAPPATLAPPTAGPTRPAGSP